MGRLSRLLGVLPALCYAPCLPMTNNAGVYTVVTRIGTPGQRDPAAEKELKIFSVVSCGFVNRIESQRWDDD